MIIAKIWDREIKVEVTLPAFKRARYPRVYLDGTEESVGFTIEGMNYPSSVRLITIQTINGQNFQVGDQPIVVNQWHKEPNIYSFRRSRSGNTWRDIVEEGKFYTTQKSAIETIIWVNGVDVSFELAQTFKIGDFFPLPDEKFRWVNDRKDRWWVTNGNLYFPLERPNGKDEWEEFHHIAFAKAIRPENWKRLLWCVVGLELKEVLELIPEDKPNRALIIFERAKRQAEETASASRVVPEGSCFRDNGSMQAVSIGENLIFCGSMFLVDSPNYGTALYVFKRYKDAYAWATKQISWREARGKAVAHFNHTGTWEEKIQSLLKIAYITEG